MNIKHRIPYYFNAVCLSFVSVNFTDMKNVRKQKSVNLEGPFYLKIMERIQRRIWKGNLFTGEHFNCF